MCAGLAKRYLSIYAALTRKSIKLVLVVGFLIAAGIFLVAGITAYAASRDSLATRLSFHEHGSRYRSRIEDDAGHIEYGEWLGGDDALNEVMRSLIERHPHKNYSVEAVRIRCPECARLGNSPQVVSRL
jgi:hypothetical protein